MYTNILVPVDLVHEGVGEHILRLANGLASSGGKITAVYVTPDIPSFVETYVPTDLRDTNAAEMRATLEKMCANTAPQAQIIIEHGAAASRIIDLISEVGADLVIIGSHVPDLTDYFLGSTAARVVRHAGCSVLVDRGMVSKDS